MTMELTIELVGKNQQWIFNKSEIKLGREAGMAKVILFSAACGFGVYFFQNLTTVLGYSGAVPILFDTFLILLQNRNQTKKSEELWSLPASA